MTRRGRAHESMRLVPIALIVAAFGSSHPAASGSIAETRKARERPALPAGATLKEFVHARAAGRRHVPVDDPAVLADVDTPADYAQALALWREQQARFVPQAPHAEPTTTEGATHAP